MTPRPPLTVCGVTLPCVHNDARLTVFAAVIETAPRSRLLVQVDGSDSGGWSGWVGGLAVSGRIGLWTASRPSPKEAAQELEALLSDLRAALAGVPGDAKEVPHA